MAKAEELDLDTSKKDAAAGGGKKRVKMILIIVGLALLVSGGVVGALYFTGMLGGASDKSTTAKGKAGKNKHDKKDDKADASDKSADVTATLLPAQYLNLQPALVANFEEPGGASYLQIEMQLMARNKHALDIVTQHMPLIRNNLLLIMSGAKYDVVKTRAGKEQLQQAMLEAVQKIVSENASATADPEKKSEHDNESGPPKIEAVYFTSFVMQ